MGPTYVQFDGGFKCRRILKDLTILFTLLEQLVQGNRKHVVILDRYRDKLRLCEEFCRTMTNMHYLVETKSAASSICDFFCEG
jgi:hypothetical protein